MPRWSLYLLACAGGALGVLVFQWSWKAARRPNPASLPQKVELSASDGEICEVAQVIDGDTIVLRNGLHLRYQGVNTPEGGRWLQEAQALSAEARARNQELLAGRKVRLKLGPTPLDAHGRVLASVLAVAEDGSEVDVEAVLLREGLARVLMPRRERAAEFKQLEAQAKAERKGLWGLTRPTEQSNPQGFLYCARHGSEVFHLLDCPSARKIAPENFVGYRTLEEAQAAGRRWCALCERRASQPPAPEPSSAPPPPPPETPEE